MRDRKKAKRREDILSSARSLFSANGIDATTMSEIADDVGVSTPTIFNYFGNKDGILIALINEGTGEARAIERAMTPRCDTDFGTILVDMFTRISERTLEIASKRVWRYAEAAAIRHPRTALSREYASVDRELMNSIADFFGHYDIRLRSGAPADPRMMGRYFFDVWSALFLELIKDDKLDLAQHRSAVNESIRPLAAMLFEDDFLRTPTLITTRELHGES